MNLIFVEAYFELDIRIDVYCISDGVVRMFLSYSSLNYFNVFYKVKNDKIHYTDEKAPSIYMYSITTIKGNIESKAHH